MRINEKSLQNSGYMFLTVVIYYPICRGNFALIYILLFHKVWINNRELCWSEVYGWELKCKITQLFWILCKFKFILINVKIFELLNTPLLYTPLIIIIVVLPPCCILPCPLVVYPLLYTPLLYTPLLYTPLVIIIVVLPQLFRHSATNWKMLAKEPVICRAAVQSNVFQTVYFSKVYFLSVFQKCIFANRTKTCHNQCSVQNEAQRSWKMLGKSLDFVYFGYHSYL